MVLFYIANSIMFGEPTYIIHYLTACHTHNQTGMICVGPAILVQEPKL
jgi:hypothetical protein